MSNILILGIALTVCIIILIITLVMSIKEVEATIYGKHYDDSRTVNDIDFLYEEIVNSISYEELRKSVEIQNYGR